MTINPQAERAFYDKQKEGHGGWAAIVWIATGLYLFVTTPGSSLFSLRALLFIVVGMFVAAVVLGGLAYLVQRGIAAVLVRAVGFPGPRAVQVISLLALALFVVDTAVAIYAARFVFHQIVKADVTESNKPIVGQTPTAWIVLTLTDPKGNEAQMSFNNPDAPTTVLADCEQALPSITGSLMKEAQTEPKLKDPTFKSVA